MNYEVRTLKYNRVAITRVNDDGTSNRLCTVETDQCGARHVVKLLNQYESERKTIVD